MRRIQFIWKVQFILIPSIVLLVFFIDTTQDSSNKDIQQFIIGRWSVNNFQTLPASYIREIEFIKPDILIINMNTVGGGYHNLSFKYRFIDRNLIKVTGRGGDEWMIQKNGENLKVTTKSLLNNFEYLFVRKRVINWAIITILISTLVIGSCFIKLPRALRIDLPLGKWLTQNTQGSHMQSTIPKTIVSLVTFVLGNLIGKSVWIWSPLLDVLLPWDAIITLEIALILIIFGIRIVKLNSRGNLLCKLPGINIGRYFGFLICGISCLGLILGTGRLIMFVLTGIYPA